MLPFPTLSGARRPRGTDPAPLRCLRSHSPTTMPHSEFDCVAAVETPRGGVTTALRNPSCSSLFYNTQALYNEQTLLVARFFNVKSRNLSVKPKENRRFGGSGRQSPAKTLRNRTPRGSLLAQAFYSRTQGAQQGKRSQGRASLALHGRHY
jgi:hypothetical protein